MNEKPPVDRLTESEGSAAERLRATRWAWPLVAIVLAALALLVLFAADLWMPRSFPQRLSCRQEIV